MNYKFSHPLFHPTIGIVSIVFVASLLSACGAEAGADGRVNNNNINPGPLSAGRLLASQCAQCHGTDGVSKTGIESLVGESRNEIIKEMREMRNKTSHKIMNLQAKGYTAEQVIMIADYFASLSGGGGGGGGDNDDDGGDNDGDSDKDDDHDKKGDD